MNRDPHGAVVLVLAGFVVGAVLTVCAVAPRSEPVAAAVDAGTDAPPRGMLASEPVHYAGEVAVRCGTGFDEVPCPVDDPQPR